VKAAQQRNKVYSLKELIDDNTPPPPEIIGNGILPKESILMIVAKQKVGKSLLAMNVALHLAAGKDFLGFRIESPHRVLFLAAEGGRHSFKARAMKMVQSIGGTEGMPERVNVMANPDMQLDDADGVKLLRATIEDCQPDIVIFDPLVKFHGADENSAKEMTQINRVLRQLITDYGIAVILVHHQGKGAEGNTRGSSAISGEYDSCMMLTAKDDSDKIQVKFELRHAELPPSMMIRLKRNTLVFGLADACSDVVRLLSNGPLTKQQLNILLQAEAGIGQSTAYRWISIAAEKGELVEMAGELLGLPSFCKN
jgi:hypothetical protein